LGCEPPVGRMEVTVEAYWVRVTVLVVQSPLFGWPPGPGATRGRCRCMFVCLLLGGGWKGVGV
jgi:hypothetical protein